MGTGVLAGLIKAAQDAYTASLSDSEKRSMTDAQRLAMLVAIYDQVEDWDFQVWVPGDQKETHRLTLEPGWLRCDGSSLLRAGTYANLFAAITSAATVSISIASPGVVTQNGHGRLPGDCISFETTGALPTGLAVGTNYFIIYNDANSFWVATTYANAISGTKINTSGSQSGVQTCRYNPYGIADGTHFNIPDMIGAVPRGVGLSTGYTANVTTNQGHKDDDQVQGHKHNIPWNTTGGATASADSTSNAASAFASTTPITDGTNGTPRTGTETKMKNVGLQFIIKY